MNAIVQEWQRCKGWIADALEYAPTHSMDDIERGISSGFFTFWPASKSAAITEVHQFPQAKHLHVFLAGGDLDELRGMVPMWQSYAKSLGLSKVTLCGRRGWERALKQQGWKADLIVLSIPAEEPNVEVST